MLVSTTSDNPEKASIKVNTELGRFCRPPLLYFTNVPFKHSRLFVCSDKLRQWNVSVLSKGMALPWCVSLGCFQHTAPIWMSWFDGVETVRHGWTSFVAMRSLSLLGLNAPMWQPWWPREGAVSFSVGMSKALSVIYSEREGCVMSRLQRMQKDFNNGSTGITQAMKTSWPRHWVPILSDFPYNPDKSSLRRWYMKGKLMKVVVASLRSLFNLCPHGIKNKRKESSIWLLYISGLSKLSCTWTSSKYH